MWAIILRYLPFVAIAAALVGAVAWIDARGYRRAQADQAKVEARIAAKIDAAVEAIDKKTADRIAEIDATDRTIIQPIITREISRDPRYSDPAAGISDGMRDALNRARAASGPSGAGVEPLPGSTDAAR